MVDAAEIDPGSSWGAHDAELDGVAGGAAQHHAGRPQVGAQRGDRMRVAAGGAGGGGGRGVEGEDVCEIAGGDVAVKGC